MKQAVSFKKIIGRAHKNGEVSLIRTSKVLSHNATNSTQPLQQYQCFKTVQVVYSSDSLGVFYGRKFILLGLC